MVQAGVGGLDTPRTNLGDATYLTNQLDFDISQEQSFQSPSKDNNNLLQQLQNGRRGGASLRTPRSRAVFGDRKNLPVGLGGGEFTPLLKSATRNSALRNGKENGLPQTPAFLKPGGLEALPEELSPLPAMGSSIYGQDSRNGSYMGGTPMAHIDSSSAASTPMAILPRRNEGGVGVLQDGNQLSLREQENVIDKIEKENFGLKLKIHFLEEALRKAGPGFSEAALKENTELKVDKVTMQKELHRYKKTLGAAERDVEIYRQQIIEMQERVKRKHADEGQEEELERLRNILKERESEIDRLRDHIEDAEHQGGQLEEFQDKMHDLEADVREKDRLIEDREDEVESLKARVEEQLDTISDLEEAAKKAERRALELEEKAQSNEELDRAHETIEDLENDLQRLQEEMDQAKEQCDEAIKEKERAEADLEELQDEMANKSVTTKGLSRQIEEKANRLQDDLEDLQEKYSALELKHEDKNREARSLQDRIESLLQEIDTREQKLQNQLENANAANQVTVRERDALSAKLDSLQQDLRQKADEKDLLQIRHDALTSESASLQRDLTKARATIEELEFKLEHEKTLALNNERNIGDEYKTEIERLNDEVEDLRAELREGQRQLDDDNDKWDITRRNLESERDIAEQEAAGLKRTIERLQEAEGTLSGKEMKLKEAIQSEKERHETQEALLVRQIDELKEDIEDRQRAFEEARSELLRYQDELRVSQREQKTLTEKVEGLEDEIEILQNGLDEDNDQATQEHSLAKKESDELRKQLRDLKSELDSAKLTRSESISHQRLESMLQDSEDQLAKIRREKQTLQDQLANVNIEMHNIRSTAAKADAEREELKAQLKAIKEQEETMRLDQERVDLRTTKMKLDIEVRRLRDENGILLEQQQGIEQQLQIEIARAATEEDRLQHEIRSLQRKTNGSPERELNSAKRTIKDLEEQVYELEQRMKSGNDRNDASSQLELARQTLSSARRRETEYQRREGAQKDALKSLMRQIKDLESRIDENEASQISVSSPHTSVKGSARKSDSTELRHQLSIAQRTVKDLQSQLREVVRDSARKLQAAANEMEAQAATLEAERNSLRSDLDDAIFERDQLLAKNASAETTFSKLRSKIDRLEKELQSERLNNGEDRTIALERRDLHDMLRETKLQAETLEVVVKERERTIAAVNASERELRTKLDRVREERSLQRTKAASAQEQALFLEKQLRAAKEAWEDEKRSLTRGVRFPNMSVSEAGNESMIKLAVEQRELRHNKELRGLAMQIEYLRACLIREQNLRANAAYIKSMLEGKIDFFKACNAADMKLLGIKPRVHEPKKRTLKVVATMVLAATRMQKLAAGWRSNKAINDKLQAYLKEARRKQGRKISGNA
ncbi:hypothetical protein BP5796_07275 [Coleophoma crateriformis]|uniref:Uncharacterized protein n=1 Tax=Coleophoma crateriformis TaxID=565419 RepID=A0A3D8RIG2_9HELO|nr:hypothetical protein BP5796_07275 [Coleophoma crateriformis]